MDIYLNQQKLIESMHHTRRVVTKKECSTTAALATPAVVGSGTTIADEHETRHEERSPAFRVQGMALLVQQLQSFPFCVRHHHIQCRLSIVNYAVPDLNVVQNKHYH